MTGFQPAARQETPADRVLAIRNGGRMQKRLCKCNIKDSYRRRCLKACIAKAKAEPDSGVETDISTNAD
jgi:hypothetical protein